VRAVPPSLSAPTTVTPGSSFGAAWRRRLDASPDEDAATAFRVSPGDALVVVVAHPDDETLAMGAALARLACDGVHVHVLVGSRGEAALDHVGVEAPGLAERRCAELRAATGALGVASAEVLGLPDGSLGGHVDAVRDTVESAVRAHGAAQVATLWREDPHPDHRAVSAAAAHAAARTGAGLVELGLWAAHWTDPAGVRATVVPVRGDPTSRRARRAAIACYRSQTEPLAAGLEAVLPPAVLAFPHEYVVRP
jgi:LmbE family N-acetylglucosaminyl deacetylase